MSHDGPEERLDRSANADRVDGTQVREHELEEIAQRRSVAFESNRSAEDTQPTVKSVRENLVGLALSGGGVRSGAFSLGVLQAFHKRGILKFIDYLSTISGGGYAGGFFSSVSSRSDNSRAPQLARNKGDLERMDRNDPTDPTFPIEDGINGYQPPRMLDFIFNARYLAKTWRFFNRYLIGLVMIWIVVLSGAIAAASFVAFSFRSLDSIQSRAWLSAIGFGSDVTLAFFPAFVLLVLWFVAWGFSYFGALTFKDISRSNGTVARYLFYLLIGVIAVAVAALFGNGDIAVHSGFMEKMSHIFPKGTVRTFIFTVIVASLLPYLTPKKLLRSGAEPRNTKEKYLFWIATRALAFGVPFILVAIFARENISGWNERRDSRLTPSGIKGGWNASSPIWHQVFEREYYNDANAKPGDLWHRGNHKNHKQDFADIGQMRDMLEGLQLGQQNLDERELDIDEFEKLLEAKTKLQNSTKVNVENTPPIDEQLTKYIAESWPPEDVELSFLSRWGHLLDYFDHRIFNNEKQANENRVYKMAKAYRDTQAKRWEIIRVVNRRLADPNLYKTLLPNLDRALPDDNSEAARATQDENTKIWANAYALVSTLHSSDDANSDHDDRFKAWIGDLKTLRNEANVLERTAIKSTDDPGVQLVGLEHEREVIDLNRRLLKAYYGSAIGDMSIVYSSVVLIEDQRARWDWFFWSLIVFLISSLFVDLNATSWHGFYSHQIGKAWVESQPGLEGKLPLARLETTRNGRPYHLITGCLQLPGEKLFGWGSRDQFLFSKLYCGSDRTAYAPTDRYMQGNYSLENAIAISGGAVSPAITSNPLVHGLLILFNVRLGQWVDNPAYPYESTRWLRTIRTRWPVTPMRVFLSTLFFSVERRPSNFVTDGGHFENLGIDALLRRRCRLIIASDAGEDPDYKFADLVRLNRWARMKHGIAFSSVEGIDNEPLPVDTLRPKSGGAPAAETGGKSQPKNEDQFSQSHYFVVRIHYPEEDRENSTPAYLIYLKSSLTGDEPLQLRQLSQASKFPHDPTADQFYDPGKFESYRELGFHIGTNVCDRLPDEFITPGEDTGIDEFIAAIGSAESPTGETAGTSATDSDFAQWIGILGDEAQDSLKRVYAAREIADSGKFSQEAIVALVAALRSKDDDVSTVARQCLIQIGLDAMPYLLDVLRADSQSDLLATISTIEELIRNSSEISEMTVSALTLKLQDLCRRNRFLSVRLALLNALRVVCDATAQVSEAIAESATLEPALSLAANKDKSPLVRAAAGRALATLKSRT